MEETQQTIDNANAIEAILDGATKISGLNPIVSPLNLNDEIALEIKSTGQTVKTTVEQLRDSIASGTTFSETLKLDFTVDSITKGDSHNIWGGLHSITTAQPLSTGVDITGANGRSKIMIVVNAGTDYDGTLTVTGEKVDRNTGARTPGFTEDITVDALSVDASTTDALGNDHYSFTACYITSEWYLGDFVLSTTDLNLSDVDVYGIAFEQFNDIDSVIVDTMDLSVSITNALAEFSGHAYSVEVADGKVDVTCFADSILEVADSNVGLFRFKKSDLGVALSTNTDGVFLDLNFMPFNQSYFEGLVIHLWASTEHEINIVVDGSLGLDSIVYGETLQVGDLVYLKSDGKYYEADNTSEATSTTELRLILTAGVLDDEVIALSKGQYTGTGFTAGNEYVGTSGSITSTRPTLETEVARIISTSINATTRYFDPSKTWINGDASKINGVSLAGISTDVIDNIHTILNATDQTKKAQFLLNLISSGETRIHQLQDQDGILAHVSDLGVNGFPEVGTGTELSLLNVLGVFYNMSSASSETTYTTGGTTLSGFARVLINAASEPTITGATNIDGSTFTSSTNMYLTVWYNGNRVEYWFEEI